MVDPDNRRRSTTRCGGKLLQQMDAALGSGPGMLLAQLLDSGATLASSWPSHGLPAAPPSEQPDLYTHGDYQPLPASGPRAEEIGAYARTHGNQRLIVAFARRGRRHQREGFDDSTYLAIPEIFGAAGWRDILSGRELAASAGRLEPGLLFSTLPVVVLASA